MAKKQIDANPTRGINAQPRLHQRAGEIQQYGTVNHALPLEMEEPVRLQMTEQRQQKSSSVSACSKHWRFLQRGLRC